MTVTDPAGNEFCLGRKSKRGPLSHVAEIAW
jgi:hypothetical protein